MNRIQVSDLHFAAYLKANNVSFLGVESGAFVFDSDVPEGTLRTRHSNSCCRRVDQELIDLRILQKRSRNG